MVHTQLSGESDLHEEVARPGNAHEQQVEKLQAQRCNLEHRAQQKQHFADFSAATIARSTRRSGSIRASGRRRRERRGLRDEVQLDEGVTGDIWVRHRAGVANEIDAVEAQSAKIHSTQIDTLTSTPPIFSFSFDKRMWTRYFARVLLLASESAWYCMRGLRPTSPNTSTHARRAGDSHAESRKKERRKESGLGH
jgi:hypothetical protein